MNKDSLLKGSVKPWHVVFLFAVFLSVAMVTSYKLTLSVPASFRSQVRDVISVAIIGAFVALVTAIVPEFRRVVPVVFSLGRSRFTGTDFCLSVALMIAWTYGAYLICFAWPAVQWNFYVLQHGFFRETLPPFEPKYLTFFLASVVIAPFAEELVFRGYLMNLWRARWGTWAGVLLSSLVFGLFHFERAIFAAVMGIAFALIYLRYDSLWPGVILHAAVNFAAFPWFLPRFFIVRPTATLHDISAWIPQIIFAVLFVPLAVMFWHRFRPTAAA
jgi:membrane protease YdiL (CAAX protease family)